MKWQKCPICDGHGIVIGGFYNYPPNTYYYTTQTTEQCRTCLGSGKILEAPDWTPDKEKEE